jgi:hypothetical protein
MKEGMNSETRKPGRGAASPITVEVTAEDIATGRVGHCSRCPLALAFHRVPGFDRAEVSAVRVYPRPTESIRLPGIAREFIHRFDHRLEVQPFSFTLEVPLPA